MWRGHELVLGALLATVVWVGVLGWQASYAPTEIEKQECYEAAKKAAHKTEECKSLWEKTTTDPVAFFTFVLSVSTIGLWVATAIGIFNQSGETQIIQRAYISVEPDGLHPHAKGGACTPTIEIVNVGKLPARNVRWTIHSILDFDNRRPQSKLTIRWPLEGEITLPPGARMKQGALEPRRVAHDTVSLRPQFGLYVYVWGVVKYDDGFGIEQTTNFCHRYNCVNLRNVIPNVADRFAYSSPAMIAAEFGRYHRYGNDAT
jgi:hypothetical protein